MAENVENTEPPPVSLSLMTPYPQPGGYLKLRSLKEPRVLGPTLPGMTWHHFHHFQQQHRASTGLSISLSLPERERRAPRSIVSPDLASSDLREAGTAPLVLVSPFRPPPRQLPQVMPSISRPRLLSCVSDGAEHSSPKAADPHMLFFAFILLA